MAGENSTTRPRLHALEYMSKNRYYPVLNFGTPARQVSSDRVHGRLCAPSPSPCATALTRHRSCPRVPPRPLPKCRKGIRQRKAGDSRESNSGPLAPEARIIPLDHYPNDGNMGDSLVLILYVFCPTPHNPLYRTPRALTTLRSPLSTAHLLPPLPDPLIARRTHSHPL